MKTEIYYFSGTGNSLAVAKDIAKKINAKLIPIVSVMNQENIKADAIGFVFPIYDFKPPKPVIEFVKKLKNLENKYIFAVATYGITPLKVIKFFDKLLKPGNGKLSLGFAVQMPHNGFGADSFSKAQREVMFKNWKTKLEIVSKDILARKEGKFETSNVFFNLILSGLLFQRMPIIAKLLKQAATKGWNSLGFTSNEKCNGCGTCQKVCPVYNIKMENKRPKWLGHCIGCFACYHWCPQKAIQFGNTTMDLKQYHHPDVNLSDMLKQKNQK